MVLIRKVRPGDEKSLAFVQTESWKAAFVNILSSNILERYTDLNKSQEMYRSLIERNIGNGYILEIDGNAHCIAWWDKARDDDFSSYAELICIHSLKDKWGQGYGKKMMDRLLDDISNQGYERVMLWVFSENLRARKFYKSFGFTFNGKRKIFLGKEELCYKKDL